MLCIIVVFVNSWWFVLLLLIMMIRWAIGLLRINSHWVLLLPMKWLYFYSTLLLLANRAIILRHHILLWYSNFIILCVLPGLVYWWSQELCLLRFHTIYLRCRCSSYCHLYFFFIQNIWLLSCLLLRRFLHIGMLLVLLCSRSIINRWFTLNWSIFNISIIISCIIYTDNIILCWFLFNLLCIHNLLLAFLLLRRCLLFIPIVSLIIHVVRSLLVLLQWVAMALIVRFFVRRVFFRLRMKVLHEIVHNVCICELCLLFVSLLFN